METDIAQLARDAGLIPPPLDWPQKYAEALERFASIVRADEREQCAKVCEDKARGWRERSVPLLGYSGELEDCAAAIRARSHVQQEPQSKE